MRFHIAAILVMLSKNLAQAFAPLKAHFPKSITNSDRILKHKPAPVNASCLGYCRCVTIRQMYNLPPGGGGGGGKDKDGLKEILGGVATIAGLAIFFLSPLGSLFFAITNSLLLLVFLLPVAAYVAFNAWQYFKTIKGPCPKCGAPCQVIKNEANSEPFPSLCFNCGVALQASSDQTRIEIPLGSTVIDEDLRASDSIFDSLFTNIDVGSAPSSSNISAEEKGKKI